MSFFETLKHLISDKKQEQEIYTAAYRDVRTGRYVSKQFAKTNQQFTRREVY